jgi:hypothetical protein
MDSLWRFYSFGGCMACMNGWKLSHDGYLHYDPIATGSWSHTVKCRRSKGERK